MLSGLKLPETADLALESRQCEVLVLLVVICFFFSLLTLTSVFVFVVLLLSSV